jgi:hypothetical protein
MLLTPRAVVPSQPLFLFRLSGANGLNLQMYMYGLSELLHGKFACSRVKNMVQHLDVDEVQAPLSQNLRMGAVLRHAAQLHTTARPSS